MDISSVPALHAGTTAREHGRRGQQTAVSCHGDSLTDRTQVLSIKSMCAYK